jgi:mannosyltransferase OCH1-like enzyme
MRIPKILHQIWVGDAPIPQELRRLHESWVKLHAGWQVKLWTDKSELPPLRNERVFSAAPSGAEKADALRLELVFRFGGVYADLDFECLQPIDSLLEDANVVLADHGGGYFANAFFAAIPRHPLVGVMIESIRQTWHTHDPRTTDPSSRCGPKWVTPIWNAYRALGYFDDVRILPEECLFSVRFGQPRPDVYDSRAYAIHYFAHTWRNSE